MRHDIEDPSAADSALRVFASVLPRGLAVMFAVEALVMLAFRALKPLPPGYEIGVDAFVLTAVSGPLMWWWIVRPLRRTIADRFAEEARIRASLESAEHEAHGQLARLRALHGLSDALAHGASVTGICEAAVAGACEALQAQRAAVLLLGRDGSLEYRASSGLSGTQRAAMIRESPWESLTGDSDCVLLADPDSEPLPEGIREALATMGVRALAVHAIRHERRLLGFLKVYWDRPRDAVDEELRLGVTIARTVALVLERTRREEEQHRLTLAVDASEDALVLTDADGTILRVNPAFSRITGWSDTEVLGQTPRVLRGPHTPVKLHEELWSSISAGRSWSGRLVNRRKDGSLYHAALTISPVLGEDARISGYVGVQRDVSVEIAREEELQRTAERLVEANAELVKARDAAEAAARAKSEFLASMSHEIRTPMNGVLGFTHLLADTPLDDVQHDYVSVIQNSGKALLEIINDVLDLSKLEANRLELEPLPFDLRRAVRDVVDLFGPQAAAKGVEVSWTAGDAVPEVLLGDEGRVRQVLTNLVGNALKFTEAGRVRVEITRQPGAPGAPGSARIAVIDTGIGIPPDKLDLLFRNFSQVDRSTSRRFGGTGLGLAISHRLVGMMGGGIGVESEPGRGSTFWFTLPLPAEVLPLPEPVRPSRIQRLERVTPRVDGRPVRVLVADDNSVNQKLAQRLLERLGCRVDVAANGIEAVELVRRVGYDVVFMDCQMPEMNGYEATRAIRSSEEGGRVPIVALTASVLPEDRERAVEAGMDDFLTKPLIPVDLGRCVRRWAA